MNDDDLASGPTAVASDVDSGLKPSGSSTALRPGDFAGDYKIVRHLGGGAMGDVYEGLHEEIGKRVAVKVIKNVLADSDEAAERFKREARAVNKIDHPNVLDVFAFGRLDDGRLYLAMDMLEGESLGERLRGSGALDLDQFVEVITPICSALTAAHERGIIHRDLKPDNVFLASSPDGSERVYILDFGIAKILSDVAQETGKGTLTGEGVWIGTPAYMAPEQWTSEGASPRSDIYALGAMAFEMLAGSVPYTAASVPAIMEKHFHEDPPHLDTGAGHQPLPEGVDRAVRRAMAKKPEDRFESAAEFFDEIRDAMAGVSRPAGKARAGAAPTASGGLERKRPVSMWAAAVGVLVLAAAVALVVLMRRAADPDERTASDPSAADDSAESAALEPDADVADTGQTMRLASTPRNAQVHVDGEFIGSAPAFYEVAEPGATIEVVMTKAGYASASQEVTAKAGDRLDLTLHPVDGFNGIWQLPDGRFREFERDGERVLAWTMASAAGDERKELGPFEFLPSDPGAVVFSRDVEVVDERNPRHKSCQRRLAAEYRYHIRDARLELRLERDKLDFDGTRCIPVWKKWGEFEALTRVGTAASDSAVVTVSSAGAGGMRASEAAAERRRRLEEKKKQALDRQKQRLRGQEKQLEQRSRPDTGARAADNAAVSGKPVQQGANLEPSPLENVSVSPSLEPSAKRQTTRAPVKRRNADGKAPPQQQRRTKSKK